MKSRVAEKGDRTVYVEHGIWYAPAEKRIHVTIPGAPDSARGAHWSFYEGTAMFEMYEAILRSVGRWPEEATE